MPQVLAPCPGRLVAMSEVPDPVFAAEMVGPGVAIEPDPGEATVVSPIAGKVVKVHPHAFVVLGADGVGVLVHLGINTVRLEGEGFEVLADAGERRSPPATRWCAWDPSAAIHGQRPGLSPIVPVVADGPAEGSVPATPIGGVARPPATCSSRPLTARGGGPALLLDLDGTLVDSEPLHRRGVRRRSSPTAAGRSPTWRIFTGRRAE